MDPSDVINAINVLSAMKDAEIQKAIQEKRFACEQLRKRVTELGVRLI